MIKYDTFLTQKEVKSIIVAKITIKSGLQAIYFSFYFGNIKLIFKLHLSVLFFNPTYKGVTTYEQIRTN